MSKDVSNVSVKGKLEKDILELVQFRKNVVVKSFK